MLGLPIVPRFRSFGVQGWQNPAFFETVVGSWVGSWVGSAG
jgi:hypothetical protein